MDPLLWLTTWCGMPGTSFELGPSFRAHVFRFERDEFPAKVSVEKKKVLMFIPCLSFGRVFSSSLCFTVITALIKNSAKGRPPPRRSSPPRKGSRCHCKDYLRGTCANPSCDSWLLSPSLSVCQKYKSQTGCKFGEKCQLLHKETERQAKKAKEGDGNGLLP